MAFRERVNARWISVLGRLGEPHRGLRQVRSTNAAPASKHLTNGDHCLGLAAISCRNKPLERVARIALPKYFSKQHLRRDDIQSGGLLQRLTQGSQLGGG